MKSYWLILEADRVPEFDRRRGVATHDRRMCNVEIGLCSATPAYVAGGRRAEYSKRHSVMWQATSFNGKRDELTPGMRIALF
jgi:hypothetical protein